MSAEDTDRAPVRPGEGHYRLLIENDRDHAIFLLDPAGCVVSWNPGAERILGFREAEVLGRDGALIFTPEDRQAGVPERELRTAAAEGRAQDERWHVRKDGSRFWASGVLTALRDDAGTLIGFGKILRDITEHKQLEEALRRAKEAAEEANRAKDEFLSVLSHELRTPLTPVLAAASAMLEDPAIPSEVRPTLELTRHNIELEARLIDDLLDVTRISRGELRLEPEVVDAHVLAHRAVAICLSEVQAGGLHVEFDLSAPEHHVRADPGRLQQVFWNLVNNAVKFTPDGGTIRVRSRNEGEAPGRRLVVEVTDTGVGIEPDLLPVIFDAFRQGEALSMRRFGGLGLGLAICRAVVQAHGGSLTVASAGKGHGATFGVALATVAPVGAAIQGGGPSRRTRPEGEQALKILVVEDDANTLRLLTRLLRARGCEVQDADCVASALDLAAGGDFDLIISDIGLPDGTGWDLMRRLRERGDIKGIAMTGFGMDEDVRRSHEAGFVAHLTKPVNFQKLEATIHQITSSS